MSTVFPIDPEHTALLNMDCQIGIVSIYTKGDKDAFLARAATVLHHARASRMTVIHVKVGFRSGLPEVSSRNQLFGAIKASLQHQSLFQEPLGAIHPMLAPTENEIVVTKSRVSAFTGTDLAMILRVHNIDTLVLFGIATSGVVLSTLLEANDADFRLAVIKDCCADLDADLHQTLLAKLFPSRATVLSAADFFQAIQSQTASPN
jgi:nicotinamidase-related amidase